MSQIVSIKASPVSENDLVNKLIRGVAVQL